MFPRTLRCGGKKAGSRLKAGAAAPFAAPLLWIVVALAPAVPCKASGPERLEVQVNKSIVLDSAADVRRVAVGSPELAEAVVATPREILIHGRAPGETTIVIWQGSGERRAYDLGVIPAQDRSARLEREIAAALPGSDVRVSLENQTVFLRGKAADGEAAKRAADMASALGKVVSLLEAPAAGPEPQVLLSVRFANFDRAAGSELGVNFFSTGAGNTPGSITTGQFAPPVLKRQEGGTTEFTLGDLLNVFIFRPDLNIGATIKALQTRRLLEILAEPNVLASNGKPASFLAGGEFPFPVVQGGAAVGAVTVQFRQFGVKLDFTPFVTPRGSIRLQVMPEVSSLDFANGLTFQGFSIPALATRRVQTEIELRDGQSFAIGGLLDNRLVETLSKIPGIGDVPVLGKLFQSRMLNRSNSELLVVVTPHIVNPLGTAQPPADLVMPKPLEEEKGRP